MVAPCQPLAALVMEKEALRSRQVRMKRKAAFHLKGSIESAGIQQTRHTRFLRAYISAPASSLSMIVPRHHLLLAENQPYQSTFLLFGPATDTGSYGQMAFVISH